MLEVKNLFKSYKSKGNVITKALDDVSLKFSETGMVFILGKSGSGKSTLLNVIGGLDKPDSGEIIVKGRSSTSFSVNDFDSYRNTFIGFIFQEYNILDELSVEDNIALALELQNKQKNIDKVNELLSIVEMDGFNKRKPNTLSGGQKQRIAIARALVKSPEIIMADEPTGALDSDTGRQVFDTLKKLSKDKLVIVVSHDRDFAESYGDRIIELKDGKVISDLSKNVNGDFVNQNVIMINSKTISIKNGSKLDEKDLKTINDFLSNSKSDLIISKDENITNKINNKDEKLVTSFINTNQDDIVLKQYSKEESKLIRSRLPIRHALKLAVSNLKIKPVRLAFTVLLSMLSFIFLGVVSTMTFYNKNEVSAKSLNNLDYQYVEVNKGYHYVYQKYETEYVNRTNLSKEDIEKIKEKYGENVITYFDFTSLRQIGDYYSPAQYEISNVLGDDFYSSSVKGFAFVERNNPILKDMVGTYPINSNEVMISSLMFEQLKLVKLFDTNDEYVTLNNYTDIIGKSIIIENNTYFVSGVYMVDDIIPSNYKEMFINHEIDDLQEWRLHYNESIYGLLFVNDSFYEDNKALYIDNKDKLIKINPAISNEFVSSFYSAYELDDTIEVYDKNAERYTGSLSNKIALPIDIYLSRSVNDNYYSIGADNKRNENVPNEIYTYAQLEEIVRYGVCYDINQEHEFSKQERLNYFSILYQFYDENDWLVDLLNLEFTQYVTGNKITLELIGFVFDDKGYIPYLSIEAIKCFNDISKIYKTNYVIGENDIYNGVFIEKKGINCKELVSDTVNYNSDDTCLIINLSLMEMISLIDEVVDVLSIVFLWAGIIFAIFATLLLFNFISVSIINKMKEIGILRAIGARGIDVFKIFFSEAFIITTSCCILAMIGSSIICILVNHQLAKAVEGVSLFVFGFKSIILLLFISLLVCIFATLIPVIRIASKKPIDSIRKN